MDARRYKVGWPYLEGTPLCVINESEGKVYSSKEPLGDVEHSLDQPENHYVLVRNILSLFPAPLREEVTEVILDLENTFHIKTYKDDSNKKYVHIKALLSLALVHPYCEAFEKLQAKILDYLYSFQEKEIKKDNPVEKVQTLNAEIQTDPAFEARSETVDENKPSETLSGKKDSDNGTIVIADDNEEEADTGKPECLVIDMKSKKKTYVPRRALVPDAVQVDVPLVYNPASKFPFVYAPNSDSERKVTRLASVDPKTMKVLVSDEYILEESYEPLVNKDGLPNIYVPNSDGNFKIVKPQSLTLTLPGLKETASTADIQHNKNTSNLNTLTSTPKENTGIPHPPPLRDSRGQIVSNTPIQIAPVPEPGELYNMPSIAPVDPIPAMPLPIVPPTSGIYMPTVEPQLMPYASGFPTLTPRPQIPPMYFHVGGNPNTAIPQVLPNELSSSVTYPHSTFYQPCNRAPAPVIQNMPLSRTREPQSLLHGSRIIRTVIPAYNQQGQSFTNITKKTKGSGFSEIKVRTQDKTKHPETGSKKRKRKSKPVKIVQVDKEDIQKEKDIHKESKVKPKSKKSEENKISKTTDKNNESDHVHDVDACDSSENIKNDDTQKKSLHVVSSPRKSPRQLPKHPALKFKKIKPQTMSGFKQKGQNLAQLVKKIKKVNSKRLQSGVKLKSLKSIKVKSPRKRIKRVKPKQVDDDDEDTEGASDHEEVKDIIVPPDIGSMPTTSKISLLPPPPVISLPFNPAASQDPFKVVIHPGGSVEHQKQTKKPPIISVSVGDALKKSIMTSKSIRCCPHAGCNQHFDSMEHAELHAKTHVPGHIELKCTDCDQTFPTLKWFCLLKHMKETHKVEHKKGEFGCYLCGLEFEDQEKLDEHFFNHYCNRYKCIYCGCKIFVWPAMQTHLEECQVKAEGKQCNYGCPFCHVVFRESHFYKAHIRSHHDNKFRCVFCWPDKVEEHDNWQKLRAHYTSKHKTLECTPIQTQKKAFSCVKCGRQYVHYNKLHEHMNNVHGDPQFKCSHEGCEKVFRTKQSRTWHEEFAHGTDLNCPECSYVAKTKVLLK